VKNLLGSADIAMLLTSKSNVGGIAFVNTDFYVTGMTTKKGAEEGFVFGHEVEKEAVI